MSGDRKGGVEAIQGTINERICDVPVTTNGQSTPEMVATILKSWSIEDIWQLVEEIEAELQTRQRH